MIIAVGDRFTFTHDGQTGEAVVGAVTNVLDDQIVSFAVTDASAFASDDIKAQGFKGGINHVAVTAKVAEQGLSNREPEQAIPGGFDEGYAFWKDSLKKGTGGWSDKPLGETVAYILENLIQSDPAS